MKKVLICPDARKEVAFLARLHPLVLTPFLDKPLLDHVITSLAESGVKELTILASDRPDDIRQFVHGGQPWGIKAEVMSEPHEVDVKAAGEKYAVGEKEVIVLDRLPDREKSSLFCAYRSWLEVMERELNSFASKHVGSRELKPGVWVGLRAKIDPSAQLHAPCWIGDNVWIQKGAEIGPTAFIAAGTMVDERAIVVESYVGSHTYVGQLTEIRRSFAIGKGLLNWETGSSLEIADPFLLSDLKGRQTKRAGGSLIGRALALFILVSTLPMVFVAWLRNLGSGKPLFETRLATPAPRPAHRMNASAVRYSRLNGFAGVWSRWPELLRIFRGQFAWTGNRPISPNEIANLENEFEELWLEAPTGLFTLADVEGCTDRFSDDAKAHASFFAVRADGTLRRRIVMNLIKRALLG